MQRNVNRLKTFVRTHSTILFGSLSFIAYGYALFPGRIYKDSATMFELMLEGRSTDQWNAFYFWLIKISSNHGESPFLSALICAALFYSSVFLFIKSLPMLEKNKKQVFLIIAFTPFVGVFGFTIGHDVTATSGILLLLGTLFNMNDSRLRKKDFSIAAVGVVLSSTSILGVAAVFGFSLVMLIRTKKLVSLLSIVITTTLTLAGPNLFSVERAKNDLSLAALVGDLKCIAQHPDSEINKNEWQSLIKLGPKSLWLEPKSCTVADYGFFALEGASKFKTEAVKTWISLSKNNPQIMLQARIQRASNALPPIFFRSPPNMFDTSYFNPVGLAAASDLQIAPDLFKTSVDLENRQVNRLPSQTFFESIVLFPTFFLNQRSDLWGWGGFWLTFAILFVIVRYRRAAIPHLLNFIPLICMHFTLVLFSPSPSPRYVFPSILVGIIFGLNLAGIGVKRLRENRTISTSKM